MILAAAVILALSGVATVLGAEPPPGVLLDGVVNVTAAKGAGEGPLAGAEVRLVARVNDFPDGVLQELVATTDAGGLATFTGVARPDEGGPPVHLSLQTSTSTTTTDAKGCTVSDSWFGQSVDVAAAAVVAVTIEAFPSSSISCPPSPRPSATPGAVLGTVGTPRPGRTPPPTDAEMGGTSAPSASVGLVVLGVLLLVLGGVAAQPRRSWARQTHRRRPHLPHGHPRRRA